MSDVQGKIFYIVGPSCAGKGTLMRYAQERLRGKYPIIFPHKYVNKPSGQAEDNIPIGYEEMKRMDDDDEFFLSWGFNENMYALGNAFEESLDYGVDVVTDGSRELLIEMEKEGNHQDILKYLCPIYIDVDSDLAERRLYERARENEKNIENRVDRIDRFEEAKRISEKVIDNSGDIERAGEELVRFLILKSSLSTSVNN